MAKVKTNNPFFNGVSGMIGNNFVIRQMKDRIIIANKPCKRKRTSEKQLQQNTRFRYANEYAKRAMAVPALKALYAKGIGGTKRTAHQVAVGDFLKAPVVHEIEVKDYTGVPGELIRVRATDDFRVASVSITITAADGRVIEKGVATPRGKRGLWRMSTSVRNPDARGTVIEVVAKDYAGNETVRVVVV